MSEYVDVESVSDDSKSSSAISVNGKTVAVGAYINIEIVTTLGMRIFIPILIVLGYRLVNVLTEIVHYLGLSVVIYSNGKTVDVGVSYGYILNGSIYRYVIVHDHIGNSWVQVDQYIDG